jgi:hypothetical protein
MRRRSPAAAAAAAAALALVALLASATCATATLYSVNVPPRLQYQESNGYCGELAIQELMLPYGVWIPQLAARSAGGGELLPGVNYDKALDALKIKYTTWAGTGGYKAFAAFAKKALMSTPRAGVVAVVYIKGLDDRQYDHILPIVGVDTASPPSSFVYQASDVFSINTGFSTAVVKRKAGDYSCTFRGKKNTVDEGGCVPSDTQWGFSILGPKYAAATGPATSLTVPRASEPAPPGSPGAKFGATLKVTGLKAGTKYRVVKLTRVASVPATAGPVTAAQVAGGEAVASFTATGAEWSTAVTFMSNVPAWYFCVPA